MTCISLLLVPCGLSSGLPICSLTWAFQCPWSCCSFVKLVFGGTCCFCYPKVLSSVSDYEPLLYNSEYLVLTHSLQANLPGASTRQLQILCVLYRQLLLAHCKAELLSGRTSIEKMDPAREKRRQKAGIPQESSPAEEGVSKMHLHCVEHELRQRVFLCILHSTGSVDPTEQEKESHGDLDLATVLIVDWVLANSTECLPELVHLAKRIHISLVAK